MNRSDSERIASLLEEEGYSQSPDEMGADLIVVNMCSVRQSAVEASLKPSLSDWQRERKNRLEKGGFLV